MKECIKTYRANAYLRLSKEDGDKTESDSIANQRDLIRYFLADKPDIELVGERIDDGYSGATFERPAFREMMAQIEAGSVDCVVVKDLSRFGRNFVETGRYLDQIFPALGVRFIAINDHFDSAGTRSREDHILLPFLNLMNDAFCRDISIKVRSQLEMKRQKGEFIGAFAMYGYVKDPSDHHRLTIDPFAAGIVREIYRWKLDGLSQQRIAEQLNELGVLSPAEYKRFCGSSYRCGFQINPKAKWTPLAVGRILANEVYTGTLVQGKRTTPNHKVRKTIVKPPDAWVRVNNRHPPIVSRAQFDTVQRLLSQDTRVAPHAQTVSLFSGLLFCGDCHQNMVLNSVCKNGHTYRYYICWSNRTQKICSSHRISERLLFEAVAASLAQQFICFLDPQQISGGHKTEPSLQAQNWQAQLWQRQEEIERCKHWKSALYEALTDGLLDEAEYWELKILYEQRLQEAEQAREHLLRELKQLTQNHQDEGDRSKQLRLLENGQPDRRAAVLLIEHIDIYEECRIALHLSYQFDYVHTLVEMGAARSHTVINSACNEEVT